MLPPGHIAGGYLVGTLIQSVIHRFFPGVETPNLPLLGVIFGTIPDFDYFYTFFKYSFTPDSEGSNHRNYPSHVPWIWLLISVIFCYFFPERIFTWLMLWLGSWTHFMLDSLQFGIMWAWPLSEKRFALRSFTKRPAKSHTGFFSYWWNFLSHYPRELTFTFTSEALLIVIALFVYFNT